MKKYNKSRYNIYPGVIKACYSIGRGRKIYKQYGSMTAFNRAKRGLKSVGKVLRRVY